MWTIVGVSLWPIVAGMNADQIAGEHIHVLLRRQGIAQTELADALGINQSALSKKLYGRRTWMLDEVIAAARFLRVSVDELLPGNDYAPVLAGRGRSGDVRPKGLEPLTFCFGDTPLADEVEAWLLSVVPAYQEIRSER